MPRPKPQFVEMEFPEHTPQPGDIIHDRAVAYQVQQDLSWQRIEQDPRPFLDWIRQQQRKYLRR